MSSQYFQNYWAINSLQIKIKYNKILKLLWKFCVILWCFYKFFVHLVRFVEPQYHNSLLRIQFSWSNLLYLFFFVHHYKENYIVLHKNKNKNLKTKTLFILHVWSSLQFLLKLTLKSSNFSFNILENIKYIMLLLSQLNPNKNLWFLKYFIV